MTLPHIRAILLMVSLSWMSQTYAAVVITGTRVIYPQSSASVTVRLLNDGAQPSLVQAWTDDGNSNAEPNESKAPFIVTPPVFRMEPNAGQALRLTLTNAGLPKDRESVFWLNVLDIPPKPAHSASNYLQMAVRSRIKIFLRPENLKLTVQEAAGLLQWNTGTRGELIIYNPTPYHFSLNSVGAGTSKTKTRTPVSAMIAPFSSSNIGIRVAASAGTQLDVSYINDFGGSVVAPIRWQSN